MVKKSILLLSAVACLSSVANAQKCATDEMQREYIKLNPKVAQTQQALDLLWRGALSSNAMIYDKRFDSTYAAEIATKYYIPVVVHVVHDYNTSDNVSDADIRKMIATMNIMYNKQNADTANVIAPFKPYIGKANFEFRLAWKDPEGNPTNGITRHFSYLTYGGDDQAKLGQWAPDRYLNIWVENRIGRGTVGGTILAYATLPSGAAQFPYSDGIISGAPYINVDNTVPHEAGHYFNLYHTWNSSQQQAGQACGDDEVDDTPPTKGHFSTCPLYDSSCAQGYQMTYTYDSNGTLAKAIVDYPDTTNVQNIMDYSSCTNMFTKQQVLRMRATLKSPTANRNNLVTDANGIITGILDANYNVAGQPTIPPTADLSIEKTVNGDRTVYMCADGTTKFTFKNQSWNAPVTGVQWDISNGANPSNPTTATGNIQVTISNPGWVDVKLTATGAAGSTDVTKKVYAADPNYKLNPNDGYIQDFAQNGDRDKWPIFNYYNNDNRWEVIDNNGYYDKSCIVYHGYDARTFPKNLINTPSGDFDDFFTPAFDLSSFPSGSTCNLSYVYAGVYRTFNTDLMKDTLEISYSTDCGNKWVLMKRLTKGDIATKGTLQTAFAPLWQGDWATQSIAIPDAAKSKDKVFFRFRYKPGVDGTMFETGTGNNFYMDRITVTPFATGVNTILNGEKSIALAPNPTNGSSAVVIRGAQNTTAKIVVTDITGKMVYSTQAELKDKFSRVEIPSEAISVKGIYMVQVITGAQTQTEKLVVN